MDLFPEICMLSGEVRAVPTPSVVHSAVSKCTLTLPVLQAAQDILAPMVFWERVAVRTILVDFGLWQLILLIVLDANYLWLLGCTDPH